MGLTVVGTPLMVNAQPIRPPLRFSQVSPLQRANTLDQRARELYQAGRYSEAIPLAEEVLAISEAELGPNHLDTATSLNNLALLYEAQGRYEDAEPLFQRALGIREAELGPNHPLTANSLNNLAKLYRAQGRYDDAESLLQHALAIREAELGANHPDTATSLNDLAELYRAQGRYDDAESLYQRALAIREAALGPGHPLTADILNGLALLYDDQGRYGEAEFFLKRALEIYEATLGLDHIFTATNLNNLALLYDVQGRYGEAEPLYQRALTIYETTLEPGHPLIANSLNNLAALYRVQGRYNDAESLLRRALAIRETELGPNHPDTANSLNELALLYETQGRYGDAEPLYQRALAIREAALGPNHTLTITILNNLAGLFQAQGRYGDAEPLYQRALAIREAELGPNHPLTATSLNNLAGLFQAQGRYGNAAPLYQRALTIIETTLGPHHPNTATSLNNLALLYWIQGRYSEAEPLYQRALTIIETALGPNHPNTATSLNNLALLYRAQDRYSDAERLYQQALEIYEITLGLNHPDTVNILNNLAGLYWVQGQLSPARHYLSRGLAAQETILSRNLVGGDDANKREYLATVSNSTNTTISFNLQALPTDPEATHLAFSTLLQRQGRILDIFTNLRAQLGDTPRALALLEELGTVNTQLSALNNALPDNPTEQNAYQAQLSELQQRSRDLNDQLSRLSPDFATLAASPGVDEIIAALPTNAALVEVIRYQSIDIAAPFQERLGAPHYAAYVLHADGSLQGIDLGPAADIDAAVERLAADLSTARTPIGQVKQSAQALDALVMAPVRELLGDTTTVFLSPDGSLNLIPFEALVDESGDYLVENYQFRYLTSGRDLLRLDLNPASDNPPLLVGNPTYGRPGELIAQSRAIDFENRIFPALPGTGREVEAISAQLPDALVFSETNATEAVIKEHPQPGILHIATHGFFEASQDSPNPLLQSGLILAGAALEDRQSGPEQDGILTALEVTGLDLRGTQLVVLSACETGIGELAAGEGVYGLRRALVLAGSHSQVISLWKVDDTATQELMVAYYDRLLSGTPRDAALRETQLAFLNSTEYRHPYYWAAFIGSGDWRPLDLDTVTAGHP
jgi:CHAT domain-containing protein/Tfp pilus assembly protein PilF